jgi:hypothetical protein
MKDTNAQLLRSASQPASLTGTRCESPMAASAPVPLRSFLRTKSFHSPSPAPSTPGTSVPMTATSAPRSNDKPVIDVKVVDETHEGTVGSTLSGVIAHSYLGSPRAVVGDSCVCAFEDACAQFCSLKGEFSTSEPQKIFIQLKNYVLSFWELENSEETDKEDSDDKKLFSPVYSGRSPNEPPNVVCAVASVKCIEYYTTHPDIQMQFDCVLRIELADTSKIHLGFDSFEQMDFWASSLLEAIDNVKMKLYSINETDSERQRGNISVTRDKFEAQANFEKQLQVFKHCESADMLLIEEDPRAALNDSLKILDFIELELILHTNNQPVESQLGNGVAKPTNVGRKKFRKLLFTIANSVRTHKCGADEEFWNSLTRRCEELHRQFNNDSGFESSAFDVQPLTAASEGGVKARSVDGSGTSGASGISNNEANIKISELGKICWIFESNC